MKRIKILISLIMVLVMLSGCIEVIVVPAQTAETSPSEQTSDPSQQPSVDTQVPDPASATPQDYFTYTPPEVVDFYSLEYETFDLPALETALEELSAVGKSATDFSQIEEVYEDVSYKLLNLSTISSLAYVDYSIHITNPELEQNDLEVSKQYIDAIDMYERACLSVLEGEFSDEFAVLIDEDYAQKLIKRGAKTQQQLDLEYEEEELQKEYFEISAEGVSVEYGGKTWTQDALDADISLDYEEWYEIYTQISEATQDALLENFAQLVRVRKQISELAGYESYAHYAYEMSFDRDYTPEQAHELNETVKDEVVPVVMNGLSYISFDSDYSLSTDEMIDLARENLLEISPIFEEPLDYMLEGNMYEFTSDPSQSRNGAYCTEFSDYDAPFMYALLSDSASDIETFVHEFGHYTNYYYNTIDPISEPPLSIDVAEVHSTALEMLFFDDFSEIYDDDAQMYTFLLLKLITLCDASLFDEFLQRVYMSEEDLSGQDIDDIFNELSLEYGYSLWMGNWTDVSHNYESPFYYISYGASAYVALDIYRIMREDGMDVAVDTYFDYMAKSMEDISYLELLEELNMGSFLDDGYVASSVAAVQEEMNSLIVRPENR